ncbi:MAG: zinc ABC transporter substrate-binding protein [Chloroflexi bacterium]|nr:zinc ABC transporter substrate-binding protein [Chloroflexota bacterium]
MMKNVFKSLSQTGALMLFPVLFTGMAFVTACSPLTDQPSGVGKLEVVATTTIVGDVVSQVGGDLIGLSILLPVGSDPHSFDPTPQDIARVAEADLIFANGAGLEEFLDHLIESAGAEDKVVQVSEGIDFLISEEEGRSHADPHTWTDPNNVMIWVHNIERALHEENPENGDVYEANAGKYLAELEELDAWIREQASQIPEEKRKLVTDHSLFGYFADEYGFDQVGALIAGYSTLAEPTAQELAELEDSIAALEISAVFVGNTVNPTLAERLAEDTGVLLIYVYTGSLSETGGDADTYLAYMRYNTTTFINALTPTP